MLQAKAFLFDMDGTLVDSTEVVENEWRRFSARFDLDAEEVSPLLMGDKRLIRLFIF